MNSVSRLITLMLLAIVGAACAGPSPEEQQTQGEALYQVYCASCHEIDQGIGPRLTKNVLATRVSATALFAYTQKNMPYNAGNTLTEEEYWAVTAYMLTHHGLMNDDVVLNTKTADGLILTP